MKAKPIITFEIILLIAIALKAADSVAGSKILVKMIYENILIMLVTIYSISITGVAAVRVAIREKEEKAKYFEGLFEEFKNYFIELNVMVFLSMLIISLNNPRIEYWMGIDVMLDIVLIHILLNTIWMLYDLAIVVSKV